MDATTALGPTFSDGIHFGLDESGARTEADEAAKIIGV